jgi:stage II sporulation protein D
VSLIRVRTTSQGKRVTLAMPIEEYVLASVLSEVAPPRGDLLVMKRIYEVQAIVARTYAVANRGRHAAEGFDLCDTTHCQLVDLERPMTSRWANLAREALRATDGKLLYYDNAPASALYHADCGGYRASAADVWGGPAVPYLTSEPDPLPGSRTHMTWSYSVERERLRAALNANPRTSVGERLDTIDVQSRDHSGRARLVLLNGARAPLVRGEDFRTAVAAALGARTVRSSRFEVRREGQMFVFTGQGFGHGVGLCQAGAAARAAAGQSAEEILSFYYPHTRLR